MYKFASKFLKQIKVNNIQPDIYMISGISTGSEVRVHGRSILMFGSNNYLGVAGDLRVKDAMINAVKKYGMGSGGSRLTAGNLDIHKQLEAAIADFKRKDDAIIFSTGYMANTGVIPPLANPLDFSLTASIKKIISTSNSVIFSDEFNHASIVDGIRLSRAKRIIYKHKDIRDLENKLSEEKFSSALIISDGVFSMDGDIAPLPQLMQLAKKYHALLMIDDAHATGVLGKNGGGTTDYYDMDYGVDIMMGTFTKAFGGVGGFVCGARDIIEYLRFTARSYIFSAPIPPAIAAGVLKSIEIVKGEPERLVTLKNNARFIKDGLSKLGLNYLNSETQIIPIFIGDESRAKIISKNFFDAGIFAPYIAWPAVPWGQSRLRITVMATHTRAQLEKFLEIASKLFGA